MNSPKIQKIEFTILIAIFLLVNLMLTRPYFWNLRNLHNELSQEIERIQTILNPTQNPDQTLKDYAEIKEQLISYQDAFLLKGKELAFIEQLENLSAKNSLRQSLDLNQTINQVNDKIYELDLRLQLTGDYQRILNYLNELNEFQYKLTVNSLNLKGVENDLTLTILASSYWLYEIPGENQT